MMPHETNRKQILLLERDHGNNAIRSVEFSDTRDVWQMGSTQIVSVRYEKRHGGTSMADIFQRG